MLHLGAVLPNLTFAADAHYHHLVDDVIEGGKMQYSDGTIAVPDGPGLGVELDPRQAARNTPSSTTSSAAILRPRSRPPRLVRARAEYDWADPEVSLQPSLNSHVSHAA